MKKTQIRQKIESILQKEFTLCYIDGRKNGSVRMKLVTHNKMTEKEKKEIEKLPHVIKVRDINSRYSYAPGICIYFDCSTKLIKC